MSTAVAPPAMPAWVAIQPECRPITSTTITRSWLSAVVCKPVDGVGRDLDGGVEAERHVGADDVVVDRLRHADDRQPALLVEAAGDREACRCHR